MAKTKFDWDWQGATSGYVRTMKSSPEVLERLKMTAEAIRLMAQNATRPGGNDFEVTVRVFRRAHYVNVRPITYRGASAEAKNRVLTRAYASVLGKGNSKQTKAVKTWV